MLFRSQQGIDWTYLIQISAHHGIIPLLYQNLSTTYPELVPQPILSQMKDYCQSNIQHNLLLTQELFKLLTLFQKHKIPAIPFKGPVLAVSVYGNLALRPFCDLDILIDEQNFLKAKTLVISHKYRLKYELSWQTTFVDKNHQINLDLHCGLTPSYFPFPFNFEDLWQQTKPILLLNKKIVNLSPEDLLIILCLQVAKDTWEKRGQLLKIYDIAQLLHTHQDFDWQKIIEYASNRSIERLLFLGLFMADDLFGIVLPIEIQQEVQERIQKDLVIKLYIDRVYKEIFSNMNNLYKQRNNYFSNFFEHLTLIFLARLLIEPSPKNGLYPGYFVWQFIHLLATPIKEDKLFFMLPQYLDFLYYLIRPIRLMIKYSSRLFKIFRIGEYWTW